MSLVLKASVCATKLCKGIALTDLTLPYDVTDNPTGWGTPNLDPTDADFVASISITNNGSTTVYKVTDQIPTSITASFTVTVDHALTDGVSIVTYTVGDGNKVNTFSITKKIFSYCHIKCCVFKKMLDLIDLDPCNDKGKIEAYLYMWALYESMVDLASGCDLVKAESILSRLNRLCNISTVTLKNCGCS